MQNDCVHARVIIKDGGTAKSNREWLDLIRNNVGQDETIKRRRNALLVFTVEDVEGWLILVGPIISFKHRPCKLRVEWQPYGFLLCQDVFMWFSAAQASFIKDFKQFMWSLSTF